MTPFRIDWTEAALDMLADIWTQAANRAAVNAAQNQIDHVLARDPFNRGQHLEEGLYKLVVVPLTVFYSVDSMQNIVEITDVWYTP